MKGKITKDILKAIMSGEAVKEGEYIKALIKGERNMNVIEENIANSKLPSAKDVEYNPQSMYKSDLPKITPEAVVAMLNGKRGVDIVKEGFAFANDKKTVINEEIQNEETVSSSERRITDKNIIKEDSIKENSNVEDTVYSVLAEILGMSNKNLSDKEYIKKTISEVYAFIKLKDSLK